MDRHLIDLVAAVVVLVIGAALAILGHDDMGGMIVTAMIGYIVGAFREQPGGLDEAVRLGEADLTYEYGEDPADGNEERDI